MLELPSAAKFKVNGKKFLVVNVPHYAIVLDSVVSVKRKSENSDQWFVLCRARLPLRPVLFEETRLWNRTNLPFLLPGVFAPVEQESCETTQPYREHHNAPLSAQFPMNAVSNA